MDDAQKLSQAPECDWRQKMQKEAARAKQLLVEGASLAKDKKPYNRMTPAEQQVLKDLTTGKSEQNYVAAKAKLMSPFLGDIWSPESE